MVDIDNVCFNAAAFIGGLFALQYGADKFVEHTAKVASRLRIPATMVTMLTAGAEWEELVVVIIAVTQDRTPLAIGNVLGSSISNILGAFSLGLVFSPKPVAFDRSSKIYTAALLALTTFFTVIIIFLEHLGRFGGAVLVCMFVVYVVSIAWAIYKGLVAPPADPDTDSDSDSDSDTESLLQSDLEDGRPHNQEGGEAEKVQPNDPRSSTSSTTLQDLPPPSPPSELPIPPSSMKTKRPAPLAQHLFSFPHEAEHDQDLDSDVDLDHTTPSSSNHLLQTFSPQGKPYPKSHKRAHSKPHSHSHSHKHKHTHSRTHSKPHLFSHRRSTSHASYTSISRSETQSNSKSHTRPFPGSRSRSHSGSPPRSTLHHTTHLLLGLLSLSLSGYVLSHSISTLADTFHLSGTVLGITFLSFATTLPEKFVSVMSGRRQQSGVLVANTAGGNIFLVTLCAGVLFCAGNLRSLRESVTVLEVGTMWVSSVAMFVIVSLGGRKWMGWGMLGCYVAFIVLEFTVNRR